MSCTALVIIDTTVIIYAEYYAVTTRILEEDITFGANIVYLTFFSIICGVIYYKDMKI